MEQKERYLGEVMRELDTLPCSHPASVNVDVANFYHALTRMIRPNLVVEIGCFIGFSTLHFAQALHEQGFGRMITIDAFDWEVDAGRGMENREVVARRYLTKSGLGHLVRMIRGYSAEVYREIEEEIHDRIDLLYIDGDHSVEGVFSDFNLYYPQVRQGGFVLLHDIYPEMCGEYGPRVLLETLKRRRAVPRKLELLELPTRDGFGIALLRKRRAETVTVRPPAVSGPRVLLSKVVRRFTGGNLGPGSLNYLVGTGGIRLVVVDAASGRPVADALVSCPQRWDEQRRTDVHGRVSFRHFLPNRYRFDVEAEGYEPVRGHLVDLPWSRKMVEYTVVLERA